VDLPTYKGNDLFEAIQKEGMDPEEFDFSVGANEATLRHLPSGASFVLSGDVTGYAVRRVAGDGPVEERTGLSWYRVEEQQIGLWLSDVKWNVNMPDLWAELQRKRGLFAAISDDAVENTPFTDAEQQQIAEQLQELKEYIGRTHSLSEPQVRLLDERLDYLVDAAKRAGRRDWLLMLAGVTLSYVLAMELPLETARDILDTFLRGIARILGQELPELPGG
jgi:hypothetical protein